MKAVGTPWLTVIIPSYCGEAWIDTSLKSLVGEADRGVEVLLIDGSPTAATRDIARTYMDRLHLRLFDRCDLKSWQNKTNFGVQQASSRHICWLGVDDVWLPGRAAAVRRWIDADFETPLHLAPCAIIDREGRRLGAWRCPLPADIPLKSTAVTERLLVQNFISAPGPVFRRDAWLECGGLDENLWYSADWDIWLKLVAVGQARYHAQITVGFRIHGGSLTLTGSRDARDFVDQMDTVLRRHLPKLTSRSRGVERAARASVAVNVALASAFAGDGGRLLNAASGVARLGPFGIYRYFRDSRIVERVVPRLQAKLTGSI